MTHDSELVSGIISISINCNCAVLGVAWAGPTDLRLVLASLQQCRTISSSALIELMCTGEFWVNINNSELCAEKSGHISIFDTETRKISQKGNAEVYLYLARGKRGEMCHQAESLSKETVFFLDQWSKCYVV